MPLPSLPRPQPRARHLSPQVRRWLDDPRRTSDEIEAFWATTQQLMDSDWDGAGLSPSLVFTDYFHAVTSAGHYLLVRFGMLPPVAGVFITYVGTGDEAKGWDRPEEEVPYWKRNPAPGVEAQGPPPPHGPVDG